MRLACKRNERYTCELTNEMDVLAKLTEQEFYNMFYHYVVVDEFTIGEQVLAIRVPGGTVGGISFDENNIITEIRVDTSYVVKTYPDDINSILSEKYVGQKIEFV